MNFVYEVPSFQWLLRELLEMIGIQFIAAEAPLEYVLVEFGFA